MEKVVILVQDFVILPLYYKKNMEMRTKMKKEMVVFGRTMCLLSLVIVLAACSKGGDLVYANPSSNSAYNDNGSGNWNGGTYEGVWSTGKQVVDTTLFTFGYNGNMNLGMPVRYMAKLAYETSLVEILHMQDFSVEAQFQSEGYSSNSLFFTSELWDALIAVAEIGGTRYYIDIPLAEKVTALYNKDSEQWTIKFLVGGLCIAERLGDRSNLVEFKTPIELYYTTTKMIR